MAEYRLQNARPRVYELDVNPALDQPLHEPFHSEHHADHADTPDVATDRPG